jgi:hypothetical protein
MRKNLRRKTNIKGESPTEVPIPIRYGSLIGKKAFPVVTFSLLFSALKKVLCMWICSRVLFLSSDECWDPEHNALLTLMSLTKHFVAVLPRFLECMQ